MTIKDFRRLKQLSEIPTHSPESLEELQELVRKATRVALFYMHSPDLDNNRMVCENCANVAYCEQRYSVDYFLCEVNKGFQLRMEDA